MWPPHSGGEEGQAAWATVLAGLSDGDYPQARSLHRIEGTSKCWAFKVCVFQGKSPWMFAVRDFRELL